ncbi:MAG: exodeoxyribonuclease VII small subunit [Lachnospiraceae bacterium]
MQTAGEIKTKKDANRRRNKNEEERKPPAKRETKKDANRRRNKNEEGCKSPAKRETKKDINRRRRENPETEQKGKTMTLEENFKELEETIHQLEGKDVSLEQSFELYKKGMDLVKTCNGQIDQVEKQILQLKENGETTAFRTP